MRRLLDADVVIGALDGNDVHHARARDLLSDWRARQDALNISVVNLSEVLVGASADATRLATARAAIAALGVRVQLPNQAIGVTAARLRRRHPISLPDAYCLATAKHVRATVATFDQKLLRAAGSEGIATI